VDEVNRIEKAFFEAHGVKVVNIQGLGYTKGEELHRESPDTAYAFAKKVDRREADCLFISCTDFAAIEVLNFLEQDLGKPAMSSNTASLWGILRRLGIKERMDGYGEIQDIFEIWSFYLMEKVEDAEDLRFCLEVFKSKDRLLTVRREVDPNSSFLE
jgi:maleate cis-trans isomerase